MALRVADSERCVHQRAKQALRVSGDAASLHSAVTTVGEQRHYMGALYAQEERSQCQNCMLGQNLIDINPLVPRYH